MQGCSTLTSYMGWFLGSSMKWHTYEKKKSHFSEPSNNMSSISVGHIMAIYLRYLLRADHNSLTVG